MRSLVESGVPSVVLRFRTWYKQSERFTSTRDQLCLQSFSVSDSESAWHLIESSPISEISSLGSNPWSSRGPGFYAVVCFLPFILKGLQKITPSFLKGMWRTGPQNKGNSPSILFPAFGFSSLSKITTLYYPYPTFVNVHAHVSSF